MIDSFMIVTRTISIWYWFIDTSEGDGLIEKYKNFSFAILWTVQVDRWLLMESS